MKFFERRKLKPIGECHYTTTWTSNGKKTGKESKHLAIFYMSETGKRDIRFIGMDIDEKMGRDAHSLTQKVRAWKYGGRFPNSFTPYDPDPLAEMLSRMIDKKLLGDE